MCRHIYDWNIVNCDVKQPISPHLTLCQWSQNPFQSPFKTRMNIRRWETINDLLKVCPLLIEPSQNHQVRILVLYQLSFVTLLWLFWNYIAEIFFSSQIGALLFTCALCVCLCRLLAASMTCWCCVSWGTQGCWPQSKSDNQATTIGSLLR